MNAGRYQFIAKQIQTSLMITVLKITENGQKLEETELLHWKMLFIGKNVNQLLKIFKKASNQTKTKNLKPKEINKLTFLNISTRREQLLLLN